MDILANEVRRNLKFLLISILVSGIFLAGALLVYPLINDALWEPVGKYLNGNESVFLQLVHLSGLEAFPSADRYFALVFQPVGIFLCVCACYMGISAVAQEEKGGSFYYLYAMPVSRLEIIVQKMLAGVVQLLISAIFMLAFSFGLCFWIMYQVKDLAYILYCTFLVVLGNFLASLTYMFVGFVISLFRIRKIWFGSVCVVALTYAVGAVAKYALHSDYIRLLSPYYYTESPAVLVSGIPALYFILVPGLAIGCMAITTGVFQNRDIIRKNIG
jgi:ABC-type transport system involved in multi-copper enzyme maturation permease subunit